MRVKLSPDREAPVRHAIESGRLHDEREGLRQTHVALCEQREPPRREPRASVNPARATHTRGEGRQLTVALMREQLEEDRDGVAT